MIRLLLLAILAFVIYSVAVMLLRQLTGPRRRPPQRRHEKTAREEEMVKDPQCGTFLPRSDAVSGRIQGETRYFCSEECRDRYAGRT